MNQQFELKLLLKQNAQMISKMQWYRRENQQLIQKNHDLNLWVQNLSQVFAAIGASWKTITGNQQALFNLMKKRSDASSKSLISKYISHFRTFDEIINNLGQKITNSGHSNDATIDAKQRLNAFVQNYQLFFKELVDGYFKMNDEYLNWVNQLKNKPDITQNFRVLANKQLENRIKIKQFESFMGQFKDRFKIYQSQNQHKLLDGILNLKNQQINSLKLLNQKQSRKINLMLNYSQQNTQTLIQANQQDYQCFCGGRQLQYFKKQWENHLQQLRNFEADKQKTSKGQVQGSNSMNKEDYDLLEFEKQKLFDRITSLQGKIEKMKIQNKLTEELVINSSAYEILQNQAQELVDYVNDLLHKITNHYNFLYEIQKAREDQILQLKQKLQKNETSSTSLSKIPSQSPKVQIQTNLIEFNSTITNLVKDLATEFKQISSKISQKDDVLLKSKDYIAALRKQNEQLAKKIQHLELNKNAPIQFRHEKFNQIQKKVTQILNNYTKQDPNKQTILVLWKQFIDYVKSRDKKVRDLQSFIKKKDKQVLQKDKLIAVLQQSLKQTQNIYLTTQNQLKKFQQFVASTQKELKTLAQKNITLRTQFQSQKSLLSYKNKTQIESKQKMQQKIRHYEAMQQQINEVRKITQQVEQNYQIWIKEQQQKLMDSQLLIVEKAKQLQMKSLQLNEKQKLITKLIEQKEKAKSEFNKINAKINAIEQKSELGIVKIQLQEYKRKIMCSCSRDQQRSVVLKTCPHAFCKRCIEDMNLTRNRKCPLCGIKFGKTDIHDIILS